MRKIFYILFIILFVSTVSAQDYQSTKDRKVKDPETKELSEEDFKKKKSYIIKLINLGYNDKTIRLKTNASKAQIKAVRKELEG